jgi:peroxiredoxin
MSHTRNPLRLLVTILCLSLLCGQVLIAEGLETGILVPPFTLDDMSDIPHDLSGFLDKGPVVLAFFRTDCSHCKVEMPLLARLSLEPSYSNIQFVGVNVREKKEEIVPFVDEHKIGFPVLLDSKMTVTRAYQVPSIPRIFFVKKDGTLNSSLGSGSEKVIREHLDSLLSDGGPGAQKVFCIVPSVASDKGAALINAVTAAGYKAVAWEIDNDGPVTESVLRDYLHDPVFRCIVDDSPAYGISKTEETALLGLLSDGGKLILFGNDVLKVTKELELMKYYVKASYSSDDSGSLRVKGVASDPDFGTFDIQLKQKTTSGLVKPDLIVPFSEDSRAVLRYQDAGLADECAAVLVKT